MIELSFENFYSHISEDKVLVYFKATWSDPCKLMTPVLNELEEELGDKIKMAYVDVDLVVSILAEYGIESVPTILFFEKGKVEDRFIGYHSERDLKDALKCFL